MFLLRRYDANIWENACTMNQENINSPIVLDLFCGCGGLSFGFLDAGYNVVMGIDSWSDAINTFQHNHHNSIGITAKLGQVSPQKIQDENDINFIDVIVGGPPCQGFSIAGKKMIDDPRNFLYKSFVSFVEHFQPKAFVMENVPNIVSMDKQSIKKQIIHDFEKLGYTVACQILQASNFGVPQNRKRAFFVGLKNGNSFTFPEPTISMMLFVIR